MDYAKATKQSLIEEVERLQLINNDLKIKVLEQGDIEATVKLKDQAVKNEFELRKELEKAIKKHQEELQKQDIEKFKKVQEVEEHYLKEIEELKKQIVSPEELEATIKIKDQAVKNEIEVRQELNLVKDEIRHRDAQIKQLTDKLNALSVLFEEYIVAYEEDLSFYESIAKKNKFVRQGLRQKIEIYNKGEEK